MRYPLVPPYAERREFIVRFGRRIPLRLNGLGKEFSFTHSRTPRLNQQ